MYGLHTGRPYEADLTEGFSVFGIGNVHLHCRDPDGLQGVVKRDGRMGIGGGIQDDAVEGDRVILISGGRIAADGPAREILSNKELLEANRMELPLSMTGQR